MITKHQADYRRSGVQKKTKEGQLNEGRKRRNIAAFNMRMQVIRFIAVEHGKQVLSSQREMPRKRDSGSILPTSPIETRGVDDKSKEIRFHVGGGRLLFWIPPLSLELTKGREYLERRSTIRLFRQPTLVAGRIGTKRVGSGVLQCSAHPPGNTGAE